MKLYTVTEIEFDSWITDPCTNAGDLTEAIAVLGAKRDLLWMNGSTDSYRRDRYEADHRYMKRIAICKTALQKQGYKVDA